MVKNRRYHTATLLPDGKVLVAGGVVEGDGPTVGPSASAELYDPVNGTWTKTGKMTRIRYNHTATLLPDGRVLVTGGWNSRIDPPRTASAELYDPVSGTWSATSKMITPRLSPTATLLADGRVLVTGGWRDGDPLGPAEVYDPDTETWTATAGMIEYRDGHTATRLPDGRVLVVGGRSEVVDGLVGTILYDPAVGTWAASGDMVDGRYDHAATLLDDGRVLVTGGEGSGTAPVGLAATELFDPGTGTWSATGPMIAARRFNTATLLADGTVLVTSNNWEDPSPAAELYDPTNQTWTAAMPMIEAPYGQTATRLLDGTVLIAGGHAGQPTTAELYDPGGEP